MKNTLTEIQTRELIYKSRSGDTLARDNLIDNNINLIERIAKKYTPKERNYLINLDDYRQEAFIVFSSCINTFDLKSKPPFKAYISKSMGYGLLRYRKKEGKLIDFLNSNDQYNNSIDDIDKNSCVLDSVQNRELLDQINLKLSILNKRDIEIFQRYYGLNGYSNISYSKISYILDISFSSVRCKIDNIKKYLSKNPKH